MLIAVYCICPAGPGAVPVAGYSPDADWRGLLAFIDLVADRVRSHSEDVAHCVIAALYRLRNC
jgi:hypothetical protein